MTEKDDRRAMIGAIMKNALVIRRAVTNCRTSAFKDRPITTNQWIVLTLLMEKEEMDMKDIAKALDISNSAVTQLVESLCEKGYICRTGNTSDRRKTVVTLTKEHTKEMQELREIILDRFMEVFHVLNNIELECLMALNDKIADHWRTIEGTSKT